MSAVFWVVVVVYVVGWVLTALINFIIWGCDRDLDDVSARAAARRFRTSWAWPLMAVAKLGEIMNYTGEKDE